MRTAIASLRHAVNSWFFLIAVVATVLILLFSRLESFLGAFRSEQLLPYGYHHSLILSALSAQPMALALPILCALPYTCLLYTSQQTGAI